MCEIHSSLVADDTMEIYRGYWDGKSVLRAPLWVVWQRGCFIQITYYTNHVVLLARPRHCARHLKQGWDAFVLSCVKSLSWKIPFGDLFLWDAFLESPGRVRYASVQAIGNNHILCASYWGLWVSEGSGCDEAHEFPQYLFLNVVLFIWQ